MAWLVVWFLYVMWLNEKVEVFNVFVLFVQTYSRMQSTFNCLSGGEIKFQLL